MCLENTKKRVPHLTVTNHKSQNLWLRHTNTNEIWECSSVYLLFSEHTNVFRYNRLTQLRRAPNSRVNLLKRTTDRLLIEICINFILTKTFSEKLFQTLSDQIETVGKIREMYHFYFNKNLLWEIVSDAFGPNWDCRKESFPTFMVNLSFTYE